MPRASFASGRAGWGKPKPPAYSVLTFPAPLGGIDSNAPLAAMPPDAATYITNMRADGRGLVVRSGYEQYALNVGSNVRTIIPFQGLSTANNKLWGTTHSGIYNFTVGGTGPWVVATAFPTTTGDAGYGIHCQFTSDAGTHYGWYADEVNGLYRLPEAGAWAAVTDITGVSELDLVFCVEYKKRMWFVERGSARAWYLPAGTISGAAVKFDFGNKFQHGGTLVGLYNWTRDGGTSINDILVAVSSTGDVILYDFEDPTDITTYSSQSQYYVGAVPLGRRIACQSGGELYLLCQYGVMPMSGLISGRPVDDASIVSSNKITPLLTYDLSAFRTERGWELKDVPVENVMLLAVPKQVGYPYKQYAMSTQTRGWSVFTGIEYINGETYDGTFYIGDEDGVNTLEGSEDEVTLADNDGVPIEFSLLTAFTDAGDPGLYHQIQFIRPVFRSGGTLSYDTESRYDYNTDDFVPDLAAIATAGALWDTAIWDTAIWGTDMATIGQPGAASGIGRALAVALSGQTSSPTTLIRIDCIFTKGGPL